MEKLYKTAKMIEDDFKLVAQDLYSNKPGLSAHKRVPMESIGHSIGTIMTRLSTLRAGVMTQYKNQAEDDNNAKFS